MNNRLRTFDKTMPGMFVKPTGKQEANAPAIPLQGKSAWRAGIDPTSIRSDSVHDALAKAGLL